MTEDGARAPAGARKRTGCPLGLNGFATRLEGLVARVPVM
jgi:hypothetical protein